MENFKVKRSGFVYSLYRKNMRNLWILAGALLAVFLIMIWHSRTYLMNYLFYRAEPDMGALSAAAEENMMDLDEAWADIQENGGEAAIYRQRTSMFVKDAVYCQGDRYRFGISLDPEKLEDTRLWYDDTYHAHPADSREAVKAELSREHFLTEHLYFYDWNGLRLLLVMDTDKELEPKERERAVIAPLSVYGLYHVADLYEAGYRGELCNLFIDLRDTPVDFEDDDFKDLCLLFPFVLLTLIPSILLWVLPALHPTYRQLDKFARSIQKAADNVDANFTEYGILSEDKKTWYLEDWIIRRSLFKFGIEKDYRKQKY